MATLARDRESLSKDSSQRLKWSWHLSALTSILALAAILNLWGLSQNGYGNDYYAAAVKSMLGSWHNFFFVSFDPGGFVSVDKPPLGLWIQTASAAIFGYSGLSLLVPQALAGIASVAVLYHLVGRSFGRVAGLIAALVLALTPVSVAIQRSNNLDAYVVLFLLLAAWAGIVATERGSLRWLLVSGLMVGLGFNVKMLQAYMILPALYLLYLLGAPRLLSWKRRLLHLTALTVVILVVSFAWAVAVDLTPASQRPYVGSSSQNSMLDLIINYNGLGRIEGNSLGDNARPANLPAGVELPANFAGGGPGGVEEIGQAGVLRLFSKELAGQASWFLVLALFGLFAAAWRKGWRLPLNRTGQSLVLWGVWLGTQAIVFSFSGFFHAYYLSMLAPQIAALVGIGLVTMWRDYRQGGWRAWLLPLALVATVAVQLVFLSNYPDWRNWLLLAIGPGLLAAFGLMVARVVRQFNRPAWQLGLVGIVMAALLASPTAWALTPVVAQGNSVLPTAGPQLVETTSSGMRMPGSGNIGGAATAKLVKYLEEHRQGSVYILVTSSSQGASSIIIESGLPVMALGGFIGSDLVLTLDGLKEKIANNTVRYFLLSGFEFGGGGGGANGGNNTQLTSWVKQTCTTVNSELWQDASAQTNPFPGGFPGGGSPPSDGGSSVPAMGAGGMGQTLYDCSGAVGK